MKSLILIVVIMIMNNHIAVSQTDGQTVNNPRTLLHKEMPSFEAKSIDDQLIDKSFLEGKVVFINFWVMACLPCMAEFKHLNEIYEDYVDEEFVMLSIAPHFKEDLIKFNSDDSSAFASLRKFFKAEPIAYHLIPACNGREAEKGDRSGTSDSIVIKPECDDIIKDFKIHGYPCTFIIDKDGIIQYVKEGFGFSEMENQDKKTQANTDTTGIISIPVDSGKTINVDLNANRAGNAQFQTYREIINKLLAE